ncbi:MAG TPA: phosphatase PAP2 family protein [Gemmataceae bacterium]|nr:phosphatase PAP2 family protein [Gemmataceae bacterium]
MQASVLIAVTLTAFSPGQGPDRDSPFQLAPPAKPLELTRSPDPAANDDEVLRWNEATLQAIKAERTPPPLSARHLAMVHCAIYDAVNAVRGSHETFHVTVDGFRGASASLAAAVSAHRVLTELYPSQVRQFDALLTRSLEAAGARDGLDPGIGLGRHVGAATCDWRYDDGSAREVRYTAGREPGAWNPTPPTFTRPLAPHWPKVTCFVLRGGAQLRPDGPPALTSDAYTAAFDEVKRLGSKNSTARTREQTEIARFWADGEGTVTPPGHWNRIAQTVSRQRGLTLAENARLFALLNVALCDVGIACWDCKFHFNFWRPIHGIREADRDGNPATEPDQSWQPLLPTPPFPAYTSGHSSFSAAAATILAQFFGTDEMRFETTSDGLPGVTRRFNSFWSAAEEAGMSRIYGGIHWQFDNTDGLAGGRKVARYVYEHCMRPR